MIEKINFDFTKKEDRKKFEKLPKEERDKISDEAQEEATLINEVVGEKGSKEDYEVVTKLAEEEIAAKKEMEMLKEIYRQRLEGILNSQLTIENIETFADNALAQTTNLIDDIKSQYQKYGNNFDFKEDDKKGQEERALKFFNLPDVPEILQSIIEVKEKIDHLRVYIRTEVASTAEVITPPDTREINAGDGGGMDIKRMFPRVLTLLYVLEHDFNIPPDDVPITRGIVTSDMVRQTPYMRVEVPRLDRVVYLCDEEGNASYIFDAERIDAQNITLNELDLYTKDDKNFLISEYPGIGIRIIQTNKWRNNIAVAIKEPISENLENIRRVSEFRREKDNWLSFEDFQHAVSNVYPGAGGVERWYYRERKNHHNWPSDPYRVYKDKGWLGFPELVEKENHLKKEWLSFKDFQHEVSNLYPGEGNINKWYDQECKNHKDWPSNPNIVYKDKGWKGWPELIGEDNKLKREWPSFENFQQEVKNLYPGSKSVKEWYNQEYKNHYNWPSDPDKVYRDKGWLGFPELVGKDNMFKKNYLSFKKFQHEVQKLYPGDRNVAEWYYQEYKKHPDWPSNPNKLYKDKGWRGLPELIGKKPIKK